MNRNEFNLEYFKSIRQEITDRIKIHYRYTVTKFVLAGVVFSFLSVQPQKELIISAFMIPSILSFFFDVLILENLGWIRNAGQYVKDRIEKEANKTMQWEHEFAQPDRTFPKSCFKNDKLLLELLDKEIIIYDENNQDSVYFDNSIENKKQLKKRLKDINLKEVKHVLKIWKQLSKKGWICFSPKSYMLGSWSLGISFFLGYLFYDLTRILSDFPWLTNKKIWILNIFLIIFNLFLLIYTFILIKYNLKGLYNPYKKLNTPDIFN